MERPLRMLRRQALPLRLSGPIIEAALPEVAVGEICEIRCHWRSHEVIAHAQVLGLHRERTVLSLIGAAHGLSREMLLHTTGDQLLGTVILPSGSLSERLAPPPPGCGAELRAIDAPAPDYRQRAGVRQRETLAAWLKTLAEQQQAIARQTALARPQGVVDRRALMLHQQRLMAQREASRQLADRQRQLEQTVMALDKQQRDALCQRRAWQRKREKYDGWLERQRHANRLTQLYRQETETEEMMTWNRSQG